MRYVASGIIYFLFRYIVLKWKPDLHPKHFRNQTGKLKLLNFNFPFSQNTLPILYSHAQLGTDEIEIDFLSYAPSLVLRHAQLGGYAFRNRTLSAVYILHPFPKVIRRPRKLAAPSPA